MRNWISVSFISNKFSSAGSKLSENGSNFKIRRTQFTCVSLVPVERLWHIFWNYAYTTIFRTDNLKKLTSFQLKYLLNLLLNRSRVTSFIYLPQYKISERLDNWLKNQIFLVGINFIKAIISVGYITIKLVKNMKKMRLFTNHFSEILGFQLSNIG